MKLTVSKWIWCALPASYRSEIEQLGIYWRIYGGGRALLRSPYLGLSVIIAVLCHGAWAERNWWDTVFAVVPSLLGFSLTGFAVFLAFGDDKFRRVIAGGNPNEIERDPSAYVGFTSSFMHFIVVQIVATFMAVIASSEPLRVLVPTSGIVLVVLGTARAIFWFIAYLAFVYSVMCALASSIALFRLVRLYDEAVWKEQERARQLKAIRDAANDNAGKPRAS